ncbi:MAG: ROK family protein [Pseudomonadota bacterium]
MQKADGEQVRRTNRGLVLALLREAGQAARTDLTSATGLSPATITAITADLITEGLVTAEAGNTGASQLSERPGDRAGAGRGRPRVALRINGTGARFLVLRILVNVVELAVCDYAGRVLARDRQAMVTQGVATSDFADRLAARISSLLKSSQLSPAALACLFVASQGVVHGGTIRWSPAFGDRTMPLADEMGARLGLPCMVDNDANMLAHGLAHDPSGRFGDSFAAIMVDSGVGAGLRLDGKTYHGGQGGAGEIGHVNHEPGGPLCRCGRRGCLEAFVSDYGIFRHANGHAPDDPIHDVSAEDIETILKRAESGDETALAAYARAGTALGYGMARLAALVDPSRIIVTGAGLAGWPYMSDACKAAFDEALVDQLRDGTHVDIIPWDQDFIIAGTIAAALDHLDRTMFADPDQAADYAARSLAEAKAAPMETAGAHREVAQ